MKNDGVFIMDDFDYDDLKIRYLSDDDNDDDEYKINNINNYFSTKPKNKFNKIKINKYEIISVNNYVICEDIKKLFQR